MKNILITGGAGFIGSNFINYLFEKYSDINVVNIDALKYASNLKNILKVSKYKNYKFIKVDLYDKDKVFSLFENNDINVIVHFAAESHVDRSIKDPDPFIKSNIVGTYNLLEAVKNKAIKKFIHISTDEVYGSLEKGKATEESNLNPSNPYSASKASSDLLCLSYFKTYNVPIIITRCSNNYGPFQYKEKFIPTSILNLLNDRPIPIYGDGNQIRDWLYVYDHCTAIDTILNKGQKGQIYNIGAEQPYTNMQVANLILEIMNKPRNMISKVKDRPGHDRRYSLDTSKIRKLGWKPTVSFEKGIKKTVEWFKENTLWWENNV